MDRARPKAPRWPDMAIFAALALPLALNDFAFIALSGEQAIFAADYASRLFALALLLSPRVRSVALAPVSARGTWARAALWMAAIFAVDRLAIQHLAPEINRALGAGPLFGYPPYASAALRIFDLTIGLAIVAFSEELVFRRAAARALGRAGLRRVGVILVSALIFGLIHWGRGGGGVASTALIGAVLMTAYLATGRFWPILGAHYAINLVEYGL